MYHSEPRGHLGIISRHQSSALKKRGEGWSPPFSMEGMIASPMKTFSAWHLLVAWETKRQKGLFCEIMYIHAGSSIHMVAAYFPQHGLVCGLI